jgi:hypothetical protein
LGIGTIFCLITIFLVFFIREIDLSRSGEKEIHELEKEVNNKISFQELLVLKRFWRMMGMMSLLMIVKTISNHLGLPYPYI